jgi:hypothetical protein
MKNEYKLSQEIVYRSVSQNWTEAKTEWRLINVYEEDEFQTCLCGHYPIREICVIKNKHNGTEVEIGNCCVKKFMGLRSDIIFSAIKRIRKDIYKSLNADTLSFAFQKRWISEWENNFYCDIMKKRCLTEKQQHIKIQINRNVLCHFHK